jgi:hypothetical protein
MSFVSHCAEIPRVVTDVNVLLLFVHMLPKGSVCNQFRG